MVIEEFKGKSVVVTGAAAGMDSNFVFGETTDIKEALNPTGSVKDRAALNMIEKAEAEGKLKPGGTIVESTSGNPGISLAAFAAAKGYHLHIFMEPGCIPERVQILKAYGVTVQYYQDIPGFNEIIANYGFDKERISSSGSCGKNFIVESVELD